MNHPFRDTFVKKIHSLYNTLLSMQREHFFEVNGLCFMMILLDQLKKGFFKHEDENQGYGSVTKLETHWGFFNALAIAENLQASFRIPISKPVHSLTQSLSKLHNHQVNNSAVLYTCQFASGFVSLYRVRPTMKFQVSIYLPDEFNYLCASFFLQQIFLKHNPSFQLATASTSKQSPNCFQSAFKIDVMVKPQSSSS